MFLARRIHFVGFYLYKDKEKGLTLVKNVFNLYDKNVKLYQFFSLRAYFI